MGSSPLKAEFDALFEVLHHVPDLLLGDPPRPVDNGSFQFLDRLRAVLIDLILQMAPEKKIWGG